MQPPHSFQLTLCLHTVEIQIQTAVESLNLAQHNAMSSDNGLLWSIEYLGLQLKIIFMNNLLITFLINR